MRNLIISCIAGIWSMAGCNNSEINLAKGLHIVEVVDASGTPLIDAKVYLSYVSDPDPPFYVTNANGCAVIPEDRAKRGGWASIIAVYFDSNNTKYMGSFRHSKVEKWPITIKVSDKW